MPEMSTHLGALNDRRLMKCNAHENNRGRVQNVGIKSYFAQLIELHRIVCVFISQFLKVTFQFLKNFNRMILISLLLNRSVYSFPHVIISDGRPHR